MLTVAVHIVTTNLDGLNRNVAKIYAWNQMGVIM